MWYKSKKQYPWNKIHNIQLVGSPAGIPLGLWPRGITQGNQLIENCVLYSTGIGYCYMNFCQCKCGIKTRTNTRGIKYTKFNSLVPLQRAQLAFGLVGSRRGIELLKKFFHIPQVLALAILTNMYII